VWQVLFRAAFPEPTLAPNKSAGSSIRRFGAWGLRPGEHFFVLASSPAEDRAPDEPADEDRAMPGHSVVLRREPSGGLWATLSEIVLASVCS